LAILNSSVKLFLKIEGADELVQEVLKMATDESDNPDLRNRGYIYWRMLSSNPELAKKIILCEKPTISEDSGTLETQILDKLTANISLLSSVYYRQPDTFVKKIRDRINERLDLENEYVAPVAKSSKKAAGSQSTTPQAPKEEEYVDSMGVKRSEYIKEAVVQQNNYIADLIGLDDGMPSGSTSAIDDLLGSGSH
jgi:vesicle coat complex subunit